MPSSGRSTFLAILLLTLCTAGGFVFCLGVMGETFLEALAVVAVIGGIGLGHYLLWGRSMSRIVEVEHHEAVAEEEEVSPETNGWPTDGPHEPRRF